MNMISLKHAHNPVKLKRREIPIRDYSQLLSKGLTL